MINKDNLTNKLKGEKLKIVYGGGNGVSRIADVMDLKGDNLEERFNRQLAKLSCEEYNKLSRNFETLMRKKFGVSLTTENMIIQLHEDVLL